MTSLTVPDAAGRPTAVTLGRNGFDGWLADDVCMGAIMGRNTSRIAGARCAIDGVDYRRRPTTTATTRIPARTASNARSDASTRTRSPAAPSRCASSARI
ncbi:hypothetical protein H7U32_08650 [Bifidobacterium pullorum subsp. saeculare]|uniref:Uncharacterized protein n=1 Tax=Bifidobacterium pullorum subsp. saeculare TaxID=78257 RepID=A0A938X0C3_9BIFI|nr:hypothetical protein [Bifidobacterium pullorum subsp. saeculare]